MQRSNQQLAVRTTLTLLCALLVLSGCGRPDTPATAAQKAQSQATATPTGAVPDTPTPTLSARDATKQADDERIERELQTAAAVYETAHAQPQTPTLIPLPSVGTPIPPRTGIETDCETAYLRWYDFTNCWRGPYNGQWYFVVAGSEPGFPDRGKVALYVADIDTGVSSELFEYPTATYVGMLQIIEVNLPRFTLRSTDGVIFVFNLDTRSYESEATPTVTPTLPPSASFPATAVLDDFNRADGDLGSSWTGNTGGYGVEHTALSGGGAAIYWDASFGADQEAYVTLTAIDASAQEIDLLLKAQDTSECNLLEVWYQPSRGTVQVWTCQNFGEWTQQGGDIAVTFQAGDQFGARATADGTVEVFKNGVRVGGVTVADTWQYRANGGRIGLWLIDGSATRLDDFGGGTTP